MNGSAAQVQVDKQATYPEYKSSGIEWLGDVPEHWSVKALKRGFAVTLGKMLQPEPRGEEDELFPYLRAANIQWGGADISDVKQMWFSKRERLQLRLGKGDLLVSEGGDVGRTSIWFSEIENCYFQNSINRVRARNGHSNRYLYYWISTIKDKGYIDILCNKSTIAHFTAEKVAEVPVPLPPYDEQQSIANFLDEKTAKIDALIEKKQLLIEFLKEKRTALISQAVTKGLDPNAKMKDSGVEWLGEVPEGWDLIRLRYQAKINPTKSEIATLPSDTEVSFVPMESVYQYGGMSTDSVKLLEEVDQGYTYFREGDVVIAKITPCFENRKGALAKNLKNSIGFGTTELHVMRAIENLDARYLFYLSISEPFRKIGASEMYGAGGQKRVPESFIKDLKLFIPDKTEQHSIANFLDEKTAEIDALIKKVQSAIDKLKEYRTALISATVTGKIDVRKKGAI